MKILAVEASSKRFSLATSEGGKVLKTHKMVLDKILSDSIIPAIKGILKDSKWTLSKVDVLIIGLGPGSFTSLRVGLSTVKGLAFAADKPVIGIPSLDAVALNVGKTKSQICVVADAKRNMVYASIYENKAGELKRKSDYLLTPLADLLVKIDTDTIFVGDAVKLFQLDIENYFKMSRKTFSIGFAKESKALPAAKGLIQLAQEQLRKNKFSNIDKLVPLYLYPEDCQVQK